MKLGIVIPSYNRKDYLRNLLIQIDTINWSCWDISVYVVVDGSTDGTSEMLDDIKRPYHKVISGDGSWWYTKCINQGLMDMKNREDYALTFNDDIILDNDFFEALYKDAIRYPRAIIGALGLTSTLPTRVVSSGVKRMNRISFRLNAYHNNFTHLADLNDSLDLRSSVVLPGRGMLIPICILKDVGLFDIALPQYHSDYDFCLMAGKRGWSIFISANAKIYSVVLETAQVTSYIRTPFSKFLKSFFTKHSRNYLRDNIYFFRKHGYKVLLPLSLMIFILANFKSYIFNTKVV